MTDGDFAAADNALAQAEAAIGDAQRGLTLVTFLRIVPWIGTQITGLGYTLDAGSATISALREAVGIVRVVEDVTREAQQLVGITDSDVPYHELSTSARTAMLDALHDAYPDFLQMQVKLGLAADDLARLANLNVSAALEGAVAPFAELLKPLQEGVDLLTPFAAVVPQLAGLGQDRQFLLLFANDTELRPGGGFIGVYGLAVTRDGEIVHLETNDVYSLDDSVPADYAVTPPAPLSRYLGSTRWNFRDANWSPDFSTSAQTAVTLMRQEYSASGQPVPDVHGVLMFTPSFISRLLTLIGPVTIEDQTFTPENIADTLEYQVEYGYVGDGIPAHQRKDIVARMTDVVVDRLIALPSSSWPQLFTVLTEGFAAKELALWSPEETAQATYVDAGWAGEVGLKSADDVLMVVDANLGALKTDTSVDRTIAYTVTPDGASYVAKVDITYDHHGSFNWKTTRYRTYTRVYAPLGSTLIASSGTLDNDRLLNPSGAAGEVTTADELGMTSFGAFTSVEPGTTGTLSFTYRLPESVAEAVASGSYELRVLKQLGAAAHDLTLDLTFPSEVTFAIPGEEGQYWRDNSYNVTTTLDTDKTFDLNFAR